MSEIRIIAEMRLKPGKKEEMAAAFEKLITGSRAEAGNISYELAEDLDDPDHLFVIESWASRKAIDEHNKTPHFTEFMQLARDKTTESKITLLKKEM